MAVVKFISFETGDASEGMTIGGSLATANPVDGSYYILANGSDSTLSGLNQSQIGLRFKLGFDTKAESANLLKIGNANGTVLGLTVSSANKITLYSDGGDIVGAGENSTVLTNQIYTVRAIYNVGAGGVVKVWINDTVFFDTTHSNAQSNITTVTLSGKPTGAFRFDSILVTDTATQPPKGLSLKVSPVSGTPTYNTWTKQSGSDAYAMWNDTPFNAADYCISTSSNGRQTAKMGAFSIPSDATINACKVAIIAKRTGGAGRTHRILRIVGGAETLTTKTLTTSDLYYDDGIWTTTVSNLNGGAIEAGGAKEGSTGGQDMQIEDVWLIVDYSPVESAQYNETGKIITAVSIPAIKSLQTDFKQTGKLITIVGPVIKTEQVDYKQTNNVFTIVSQILESDTYHVGGTQYEELNRFISISSIIDKTEQVDYKQTGKSFIISGPVVQTEQVDYKQINKLITATSVANTVEQVDFKQINKPVSINSLINETEKSKRIETGKLINLVSVLGGTEQVDYKEIDTFTITSGIQERDIADYTIPPSSLIAISLLESIDRADFIESESTTINALIYETDEIGVAGINYDESGKVVTISSLINKIEQVDYNEIRNISIATQPLAIDRADYSQATNFIIESLITKYESFGGHNSYEELNLPLVISSQFNKTEQVDYNEIQYLAINTQAVESDTGSFTEANRFILLNALISETDIPHTYQSETGKLISINAQVAESDRRGLSELVSALVSSQFSEMDSADYNEHKAFDSDAIITTLDLAAWVETGLQLNIAGVVSFIPRTQVLLPISYTIEDLRTQAGVTPLITKADIKDTRTSWD